MNASKTLRRSLLLLAGALVVTSASLQDAPPPESGDGAVAPPDDAAPPRSGAAAERIEHFLEVGKLYHGVERPVVVTVSPHAPPDGLSIQLIAHDGEVIVPDYNVERGQEIDLNLELPIIWRLRQAAYLQLMQHGDPIGSALVLQPMLSRPPIWTQKEYRPDGTSAYTRVVGWGSEPPEQWREQRPKMEDTDGDGEPDTPVPPDELEDPTPEIEPEVFSGLRIYAERDIMLRTSQGDLRIALAPEEAPNTAWNFRRLVEEGFYDDVIFHRIVPLDRNGFPFVIQGGDPTGEGNGGPGYWLPLEPSALPHDFGVVSMARADDPDSAGSQFFICLSREGTARLDGQYCAFGYVVEGAGTIRNIAGVELADPSRGRPAEPPLIIAADVVHAPPRMPGQSRWIERVNENDEVEEKPTRVPR